MCVNVIEGSQGNHAHKLDVIVVLMHLVFLLMCAVRTGPKGMNAISQRLIDDVDQDVVYYAKLVLAQ